jgi:hypothetical protein
MFSAACPCHAFFLTRTSGTTDAKELSTDGVETAKIARPHYLSTRESVDQEDKRTKRLDSN